jgi:hypothetical protein
MVVGADAGSYDPAVVSPDHHDGSASCVRAR